MQEDKKTKRINGLDWLVFVFIVVGALNWGLVGFFNFNLITAIFGIGALSNVVFSLVGIAALYAIFGTLPKLVGARLKCPPEKAKEMKEPETAQAAQK